MNGLGSAAAWVQNALLRRRFRLAYRRGNARWDTNQTPPELIAVIEGPKRLPPGKALDLGCGTGTNVVYLAQHGWQATGVDFAPAAIAQAEHRATTAGVRARFYVGDVSRLTDLPLDTPFDFALDLGCLHGIPLARRNAHAQGLAGALRPGATYLLYAFAPRRRTVTRMGLAPDDVRALFDSAFTVEDVVMGVENRSGGASAWYTLRRR